MLLPDGTLIRITKLRKSHGVWWARVAGEMYGNQYANILHGPPIQAEGDAPYLPPLRGWNVQGEEYTVEAEDNAEFCVAQATHALLGRVSPA